MFAHLGCANKLVFLTHAIFYSVSLQFFQHIHKLSSNSQENDSQLVEIKSQQQVEMLQRDQE